MTLSHKKLFLILTVIIIASALILFRQILTAKDIITTPTNEFVVSPGVLPISLTKNDPILGNPGAAITIIAFNDLGCKKCKEAQKTLISFVENHPKDVKLIWKDLPKKSFIFGDDSPAHVGALCAHEQKQFWPFVKKVLEKNTKQATLKNIAQDLHLNIEKWENCTIDLKTKKSIEDAQTFAKQLGITKIPTIFVNNKEINLKEDINLEELLNSLL